MGGPWLPTYSIQLHIEIECKFYVNDAWLHNDYARYCGKMVPRFLLRTTLFITERIYYE